MPGSPVLPLTGGCNCGVVRFEISEPLLGAVCCHCTRCQRRTGTAAAPSAGVKPGTFRIVSGEGHIRRWNAGDGNDKAFCGTCGSALFSQNPASSEGMFVRMGSFDGDPGVRPGGRVHVAAACPETGQMVRFRDRLRSHPADRRAHEQTKRELAARPWTFVQQYADAKSDVIASILASLAGE